MSASRISSIQNSLAACFRRRREIQAAYIFGSVVSGRTRPDSDIDIAVLVDSSRLRPDSLKYRLRLMSEIASALGRSDIDLVLLNEAPPELAQNVLSGGRRIFERSRSARVAFQVRTLNLFMDTEPMRRLYLQYLKRRYLKGDVRG
jgi:predicted nucleotidyltransferase